MLLPPEIIVQLAPRDDVGAVFDRPLEVQSRIHENNLRDDVIADERLAEGHAMVAQILDHGVPPLPVGLEHVRVLHDLTAPAGLAPHTVPDVQPARPVLDLDQVDHLRRADDQIDLAATPLPLRRDATPGEDVGVLKMEGRADQLLQQRVQHPGRPRCPAIPPWDAPSGSRTII